MAKKMQRVREIAYAVKSGSITAAQGFNKVLMCVKSLDMFERESALQYFKVLCA